MEYPFREIEQKWQQWWKENKVFKTTTDPDRPKFYVLDMFPYPSGAGLHVGHPLGYIASDIYARYKRLHGFNVLHPMGFDAFGLPAEQYAIQTGTHPAVTTEKNIRKYREQLEKLGFAFDWDREVVTCDPDYYKWTQWTFIRLFNSWYNNDTNKAEPIENLTRIFVARGNTRVDASTTQETIFSAEEWNQFTEKEQQAILMNYRLAYLSETWVNWCPDLGTVLANDEVKDGFSERGGYPVERKKMKQWALRITAYAQRLLDGLEMIDWTESIKEVQRNWIGRSQGAVVFFTVDGHEEKLEVFTTRPDTLFGATFMVLAPEHPLVEEITTKEQEKEVREYVRKAINRSERDRIADVKTVSGVFTGAYGINPVNQEKIPIWVAEYVLAGYGTGAIMAVPGHDSRDFTFARHFNLPIVQVVTDKKGETSDIRSWDDAFDSKEGYLVNSAFLNDLPVNEAIQKTIDFLKKQNAGFGKVNFRLRDAIFSRQRYWGEPFPIYYKEETPYPLSEDLLPLTLPEVDKYLPTESGDPPLARAKKWTSPEGYPLETSTMPGFAGSSGYYLRYMDPHNREAYFSPEANQYWKNVDLYIGGDEHATGHLIYSRFWNKFLYDLGLACMDEPFQKLINQGKIQGRSSFVYRAIPEKYAAYLLWEEIKKQGLTKQVVRDFREGHRTFSFYFKEKNLFLDIKTQEKETDPDLYNDNYNVSYLTASGRQLLLVPAAEIIEHAEKMLELALSLPEEPGILHDNFKIRRLRPLFVSVNIPGRDTFTTPIHVDINLVQNDVLDREKFKAWRPEFREADFILENEKYVCGWEIEKMSKSKHNVQNPDDLIERYGADTLRIYEMFLGPVEQSKPWDTNGIEGVFRFIKKWWRLFHDQENKFSVSEDEPTEEELKILHKTIRKVTDDIERYSFHTVVSNLMIGVNELTECRCNKRPVLEKMVIMLSPYAPHISEELWEKLGHATSVSTAGFPVCDEKYLIEQTFEYPVSFNGKLRFKLELSLDLDEDQIKTAVLNEEKAKKWIEGKTIRKVIVIPGKIVNVVVS